MSLEDSGIGQEMGKYGLGYRVLSPGIVSVGKDPMPGLAEGPGKRRGIQRESNYIGTALPKSEAKKIATQLNKQKGIKSVLPWERVRVVEEKMG